MNINIVTIKISGLQFITLLDKCISGFGNDIYVDYCACVERMKISFFLEKKKKYRRSFSLELIVNYGYSSLYIKISQREFFFQYADVIIKRNKRFRVVTI